MDSSADEYPTPESHDRAWIAGVRAGDAAAFDAIFDAYYEGLCLSAAGIVGSDAVAEEVVQEAFLQIWRRREQWEVPTTVAAYLYRAVRNRAIGYVRHGSVERRWRDRTDPSHAPSVLSGRPARPDEELQGTELSTAIDRAIAALPPRCREAFVLRRQHGLSYGEIAETMGIAPKTVEVQVGAALRSLRAALRDWLS